MRQAGNPTSSGDIEVVETSSGATISVGPQAARCSLNSPIRGERIGGWICVVVFSGMLLGCLWLLWKDCRKIASLFPASHRHLGAWILLIVVLSGGGLLVLLMSLGVALMAIVAVCDRRVRMTIDRHELVEHYCQCLYRRRRRIKFESIRRILIHPGGETAWHRINGPLRQRPATLRFLKDDGSFALTRGQYPHELACALAAEVAAQISRVGYKPLVRSSTNVDVIDAMDPVFLNSDDAIATADYSLKISPAGDGMEITEELPRRSVFAGPNAGRIWIVVVVSVLPFIPYLFFFICEAVGVPASAFKDVRSNPLRLDVLLWIWVLVVWQLNRRRPKLFRITADHLEVTSVGRKRGRKWNRVGIVAVRVAYHASSRGSITAGVKLETIWGINSFIADGDVMAMRYLAASLRAGLGVPAESASEEEDIHEVAWHLIDDHERPPGFPFTSVIDGGDTVIRKPAPGITGLHVFSLLLFGLFLLAGVVAAIVWLLASDPVIRREMIACVILLGGLGAFGIIVALYDAKRSYDFVITPDAFGRTRRSVFGARVDRWTRDELVAVGTRPPSSPGPDIPLKIAFRDGKKMMLIGGRPKAMRYLATLMRDALQLPALGEDELTTNCAPVRVTHVSNGQI